MWKLDFRTLRFGFGGKLDLRIIFLRGFLPSGAWICMFVQKTRVCLCKNASAFEEKRTCVSGEMHLRLKGNVLAFPEKAVRRSVKKDGKIV